MAGRWWKADSSSEEDSSSSSSGEQPVAAPAARKQKQWSSSSSESSAGERKRVVRSHTDKRIDQMMESIRQVKKHQKEDDFAGLTNDYDSLMKMVTKNKALIEQPDGPPRPFVKVISNIATYIENVKQKQQQEPQEKKSDNKRKTFNALTFKVRKGNKQFEAAIAQYKENPSDSEPDGGSDVSGNKHGDESSSGSSVAGSKSSDSSSDSDSYSGSSSSSGSSSDSGSSSSSSDSSDSDSDSSSSGSSSSSSSDDDSSSSSSNDDSDPWEVDSEGSSDDEDLDEDAVREKRMLRWLIDPKSSAEKPPKQPKPPKPDVVKPPKHAPKPKLGPQGTIRKQPEEEGDCTLKELTKKVQEITQERGKKKFDRNVYSEKLSNLLPAAQRHGARPQLLIMTSLVAADFDNTGSASYPMKMELWKNALEKVNQMLPLLVESYGIPRSQEEIDAVESPDDPEGKEVMSHERLQQLTVKFIEKLDDELYKALQYTMDVYGAEYQDILANSTNFLILIKRVLKFFEETEQAEPRGLIARRLMEQIYYKPDMLNARVYEAISHMNQDDEGADWVWPSDSKLLMAKLGRYVFATGDQRLQRKASLYQAYHLALHDQFQAARDLLQLGNLQELVVNDTDVHTQILYNRVLAQMGLCAFRLGKIPDGHNCLMDVCMHNKARELLAQGLSYSKMVERTAEQERAERLRQLPYHMHINLEVLETAHHICAMLLEVPNMAMQSIDPNNKRIISRVLRRLLEQFDKQIFSGPPENAKEAVVGAAKALQRGDWQNACQALENLKIWDHVDPGNPDAGTRVKNMIKDKMKVEALRTYLFAYASIYDAFHLDQLVEMFDLQPKAVHSIVSKMMLKEEISAFWDESSEYVLMQHTEPSPLQRLALKLAEQGSHAVENNERLIDQKTGGYGFKDQRPEQRGRWDMPGDRRRYGKGGPQAPVLDDGKGRKGKGGRGKIMGGGPPRNRGWENARAGLRGTAQRGWSSRPS